MRSLLERYLGASFVLPFCLSLFFFVSFLITFQLFRVTKLVINKGVPVGAIFELLGHIGISFLPMAIPLSVLFAMIFTMNKISGDSEFMAMRSFGMSKFRVFRPFLVLGVLIAITAFTLNRNIIPLSKREFKRAIIILTSRGFLADIKSGKFFTAIPNVVLFSEDVTDKGNNLSKVFISVKDPKKKVESIILAEKGHLLKENRSKWGHASLRMVLENGNITKLIPIPGGERQEKILFERYEFPLSEGKIHASFVTKDSMRTSSELKEIIVQKAKRTKQKNFDRKSFVKSELEYWTRINTPLQILVFILLGFCLGVKNTRGKSRNSGLITLLILVAYYSLYFTGISIARGGNIPVTLSVFLPTVFSGLYGIKLFRNLEWLS